MESQENLTPEAALDLASQSRAQLSDAIRSPWWYYPAMGLLTGVLTAVALAGFSDWIGILIAVVFAAGTATILAAYRRTTGMSVRELPTRRLKLVVVPIGFGLGLGLVFLGSWVGGDTWGPPLVGLLVFLMFAALGPRYDAMVRKELRSEL